MKQRMILYGLTLMLGCFVLASCINDEEGPCLSDGKAQVLFSLVLQENAQTRADGDPETWGDFEIPEPGVGYDNQIKLDEVQVLLFKDNAYLGKLTDLFYTQPDPDKSVYQYIGTAPLVDNEILTEGDYKFVVLANSNPITPASLDDENFAKLAFTYLGDATLPNIPMWGTTTAHLKPAAGTRDDIGPISLLRAVSKVTVKLAGEPNDLKGYSLTSVTVKNYNKSGYVLPSAYADVVSTTELEISTEKTLHVNEGDKDTSDAGKVFAATTGTNEVTFYLPEYDNVSTGATPSVLSVKLTKETGGGEFVADINFCDYYKETTEDATKGTPVKGSAYNIVRNHHYQFNIFKVSDAGELYVKPTVAPWTNAPELEYIINMSTNMRLFDSWLYRYDTDNTYAKKTSYDHWAESHIAVSSERGIGIKDGDIVIEPAGRPLQSPQIQLVTTGTGTFELYVDNDDFEIVEAIKDGTGVVQRYNTSEDRITEDNPKGTLTIAAGVDVYTYFYIVPKAGVTTFANPVAKVFLYYNDPELGKQEVPFNNNSLPGYSDDSSEIWAYYVTNAQYQAGKIGDNTFMKMYYQDVNNPLVPVNP